MSAQFMNSYALLRLETMQAYHFSILKDITECCVSSLEKETMDCMYVFVINTCFGKTKHHLVHDSYYYTLLFNAGELTLFNQYEFYSLLL